MRRLLLLAVLATAASAQVPDGLAGRWSSAAICEGGSLRLFDLEIAVAGPALDVTLTQPYNGFTRFGFPFAYEAGGSANGFLVAELFVDEMRLLVDLADGTLRGSVVSDGATAARVSMERVLDYPLPGYRLEEVSFTAGRDTLAGSLILPEGEGPFPTAVLDATLDFVRTRPEARLEAIGVLSNSAGAWVTPLAIQDRDDVAFWVALVPPAGGLAHQRSAAVRETMRRSGEPFTEADYADLPDEQPADEQPAYFARRTSYDNTAALRRLRVPTLAIFGADDVIVPPGDHGPSFRALYLTVLVLPGVDHSLGRPAEAVGEGAWPTGYQRVWGRPGVLFATLVDWTRVQVGLN